MIIFSTDIFATTKHRCIFKKFEIKIKSDEKKDVILEVFKGKYKISSCIFKVSHYEKSKRSSSVDEVIKIKKNGCSIIYDKISSEVRVIDEGFIKMSSGGKISYAYVVKNEQPIRCQSKL